MSSMGKSFIIVIVLHLIVLGLFYFKSSESSPNILLENPSSNHFQARSMFNLSEINFLKSKKNLPQKSKNSSEKKEVSQISGEEEKVVANREQGKNVTTHSKDGSNSFINFEAQILKYSEPIYPKKSLMLSQVGEVELKLEINNEGKVLSVEILKSSGHKELDRSAQQAAYNWLFKKNNLEQNVFSIRKVQFKLN